MTSTFGPWSRRQTASTCLVALALGTLASACNPTPAVPELSDPREILASSITTTAGLRTMRVRIDAEIREGAKPASQGGAAEAVVDLAAGELSATGAAMDGSGRVGLIVADGSIFVTSSNGRWMKTPMAGALPAMLFGAGLGGQANLPAVLADLADDAETSARLEGTVDCASGRCYRVQVELPPAQVWKLIVAATGLDRPPAGGDVQQPPLDQIPALAFDVFVDTATLRLVDLVASGALQGTTVLVRIQVASPNEPVDIQAPPPGLVDDMRGGFGGDGGGVVAPAPVPIPAESIGP